MTAAAFSQKSRSPRAMETDIAAVEGTTVSLSLNKPPELTVPAGGAAASTRATQLK